MALDPRTWLTKAQALKEGVKRRDTHDCGGGRTLLVEHKETGWAAWCHRCNDNGFVPHPAESLAEKLERMTRVREVETQVRSSLSLPLPKVLDPKEWPIYARVWMYAGGFSNPAIEGHGIYYHPRTDRVVMPVYEAGRLVYWVARGFDADLPKYINSPLAKLKAVPMYGDGPCIILTEDLLSAMRVGEVTTAWCILGTSLHDGLINRILKDPRPVGIWLDGDKAGEHGSYKAAAKLRLLGREVFTVHTPKDPKLYSKDEIYEIITNHREAARVA